MSNERIAAFFCCLNFTRRKTNEISWRHRAYSSHSFVDLSRKSTRINFRNFSGRHQGRGQALYSSLSFGAGGAAGSFVSGMGWETIGPDNVYLLAAGLAFIALLIAWVWVRPAPSI